MKRLVWLTILGAAAVACNGSPSAPSSAASLRVQVIDDVTRQPITDPVYRLELQLTGTSNSYSQPVVNGAANFAAAAQGEYRLTTSALFGYLQLDYLNVRLDRAQSMTLSLAPIDDLGVEQISVDGQGSIPVGGTIAIAGRGVTLRMRGKYQSPRSPWPARNIFRANVPALNPDVDGFGHLGGLSSGVLSPDEFEITMSNWTPCSGIVNGRFRSCYNASDIIMLSMSTPSVGGFGDRSLIAKHQKWALKYELAPGCCLP